MRVDERLKIGGVGNLRFVGLVGLEPATVVEFSP